jgi:nitric oxide reductase NorD protein
MGGAIDPPPLAKRRRVIDVAKESLALMCDALRTLGDTHAVYGFSGEGRDHVEFHVARDFGDAFSARTWAALAAMEPKRSTRMGPAIRHAAAKLGRQPEAVKVLIVVSDGYPQDSDYGPDRRDEEYGIQDTARALREAADAGISTFCVTIDPAGHDYLQRMCERDRYMVIDDVAALPGELTKVYRSLTA